jgi:hypothetical protein
MSEKSRAQMSAHAHGVEVAEARCSAGAGSSSTDGRLTAQPCCPVRRPVNR